MAGPCISGEKKRGPRRKSAYPLISQKMKWTIIKEKIIL
jgi:hypothetical protein